MGQTTSLANDFFQECKLEAALEEYHREIMATDNVKEKSHCALQIGLLYQLDGKYQQAREYLDLSLSLVPNNGMSILHKAILFYIDSKEKEVLQFIQYLERRVLMNIPKGYMNHIGLALCLIMITLYLHKSVHYETIKIRFLTKAHNLIDDDHHPIYITATHLNHELGLRDVELYKEKVSATPYFEVWDDRGKELYIMHSFFQALMSFQLGLALNPLSCETRLNMAMCYFEMGEYTQCLKVLSFITKVIDVDHEEAWKYQGHCHLELRQYEQAYLCYEKVLTYSPQNIRVLEKICRCVLKLKKEALRKMALETMKNALTTLSLTSSSKSIKASKIKCHYYLALQKYTKALALFDKILLKAPNNIEVLMEKAKTYRMIHDYVKAIDVYERIIHLNHSTKEVWYYYAKCLLYLERYCEGIQATEQCLKAYKNEHKHNWNHDFVVKGFVLPLICDKYHDYEEERLYRYDDIIFRVWHVRSQCLWKLDQLDDAIRSIDKALEMNPLSSFAWETKGNILSQYASRADESLECFKMAHSLNPTNPWTVLPILSIVTLLNRENDIMEYSKKLYELTPDDPHATCTYGNLLYSRGRYEDVYKILEKEDLSEDLDWVLLKIKTLYKMNEPNQAQAYYREKIKYENTAILNDMGRCMIETNRWEEAYKYFKRSREIKREGYKSNLYISIIKMKKEQEKKRIGEDVKSRKDKEREVKEKGGDEKNRNDKKRRVKEEGEDEKSRIDMESSNKSRIDKDIHNDKSRIDKDIHNDTNGCQDIHNDTNQDIQNDTTHLNIIHSDNPMLHPIHPYISFDSDDLLDSFDGFRTIERLYLKNPDKVKKWISSLSTSLQQLVLPIEEKILSNKEYRKSMEINSKDTLHAKKSDSNVQTVMYDKPQNVNILDGNESECTNPETLTSNISTPERNIKSDIQTIEGEIMESITFDEEL